MRFPIRIKIRRTGLGVGRRKSKMLEPCISDEPVSFILTPEPREVTNDTVNDSKASESAFKFPIPLVVTFEPTEFTNDAGNESMASEGKSSSFDRNVTGWQYMWSCLGLDSPRQDLIDDLTFAFTSEREGSGETTHSSSFESSCSSYDDDDEGSGESSQPAVSRVDQVLILSPMADDISDISSSSSDDCEDDFDDGGDYDNGDGDNDDFDNDGHDDVGTDNNDFVELIL
jgi:hypothetical protein